MTLTMICSLGFVVLLWAGLQAQDTATHIRDTIESQRNIRNRLVAYSFTYRGRTLFLNSDGDTIWSTRFSGTVRQHADGRRYSNVETVLGNGTTLTGQSVETGKYIGIRTSSNGVPGPIQIWQYPNENEISREFDATWQSARGHQFDYVALRGGTQSLAALENLSNVTWDHHVVDEGKLVISLFTTLTTPHPTKRFHVDRANGVVDKIETIHSTGEISHSWECVFLSADEAHAIVPSSIRETKTFIRTSPAARTPESILARTQTIVTEAECSSWDIEPQFGDADFSFESIGAEVGELVYTSQNDVPETLEYLGGDIFAIRPDMSRDYSHDYEAMKRPNSLIIGLSSHKNVRVQRIDNREIPIIAAGCILIALGRSVS